MQKFKNLKKPYINNQIRAREVRIVDESGKQYGVLELGKAIEMAKEKNLDLIQVTDKVEPPVCRIMDYGKYLYRQKKKEKEIKHHQSEVKGIRLSFSISEHDMTIRAKQAESFIKKGDKVRIEMRLRGREKALQEFAREKIKKFIEIINDLIPIKIEGELKKYPRGLIIIIAKR